MEAQQFLLALTVAIAAIHLATVAGQHLGRLRDRLFPARKSSRRDARQRDDWYVFFHCADLLGKEKADRQHQSATTVAIRREPASASRRRARL